MASALTWLDYSERDRRRALDVIDLFRETGTVDELGLTSVRDSFSDLFFPGTSTIQTRACYFLLVPWTFTRLERSQIPSSCVAARARQEELKLSGRMLAEGGSSGIFGSQAGMALKRLPSEVYWGGLGSWGIRIFQGHMGAYFRSLDGYYRRSSQFLSTPRDPEGRNTPPVNWHPHLPDPPSGFPSTNVSVTLRRKDAEYLRDRIQSRHPGSLLAVLAGRASVADLQPDRPWRLSDLPGVSPLLGEQLHDARLFAICMHGAALLYNLMLSELQQHEQRIERYRARLIDWAAEVGALEAELADWRLNGVWTIVRSSGRSIGSPTMMFIERWVEYLRRSGPDAIASEDSKSRTLVKDREVQLKRGRARLENRRYLELWGGESGTAQMSYRWSETRRILRDIFDGLEVAADHARDA